MAAVEQTENSAPQLPPIGQLPGCKAIREQVLKLKAVHNFLIRSYKIQFYKSGKVVKYRFVKAPTHRLISNRLQMRILFVLSYGTGDLALRISRLLLWW